MPQEDSLRTRIPVQEMDVWLTDVQEGMGHTSRSLAYHALRGVLTALRDSVPLREAYDLAAHLPLLVRTVYFHGYQPLERTAEPGRAAFLSRVRVELRAGGGSDAVLATQSVLRTLEKHIGEENLDRFWQHLPEDVRSLREAPLVTS